VAAGPPHTLFSRRNPAVKNNFEPPDLSYLSKNYSNYFVEMVNLIRTPAG